MISVDGVPFPNPSSSSSSSQGSEILEALLEHPVLVSASNLLKSVPASKISVPGESDLGRSSPVKCVYVFQREYATVDPALVEIVGTDEATTCVGLVIRNRRTGMTSVAHMDSPGVVDLGLTQMMSLVNDHVPAAELDVHLIGGYEDASHKRPHEILESEFHTESDGYSFPLCSKIVEALQQSKENFHIQTICVLKHNTRRDSDASTFPIFTGFVVETSTGLVRPAIFDRSSRCPDEIVRRIRLMVSSEDPTWSGKLLETYDTHSDQYQIAPCCWTPRWKYFAFSLQQLSDSEILLRCSTSPDAEGPDFVDKERRLLDYLIRQPNWRETFPMGKPRMFRRTADGQWLKC